MFEIAVLLVGLGSGAVAAVSGFGIGSLLTPLLALEVGARLAVTAVALPHAVATALRCWRLRDDIDPVLLRRFGLTSAVGGLAGAVLHNRFSSPLLSATLGVLLLFVGALQVTGFSERWRLPEAGAWAAGAASGLLGGLVGNQGGIRSAAMLSFDVSKRQFVATGAAIALLVDGVRVPVYLAVDGASIGGLWFELTLATIGVTAGTILGGHALARLPARRFRQTVGALLLVLGVLMLR